MPPVQHEEDWLNARIDEFEAALEADATPRTFAPLAELYRLAGRVEEAVRTAERGVHTHPDHLGIRIVLARALADAGDSDRALSAYREVLDRDPDNVEARVWLESVPPPAPGSHAVEEGEPEPQGGRPARQEGTTPDLSVATGTLSEELAHLADLFMPSAGPSGGEGQELGPESIATLTLAEIYSRQDLPEKAAEVCERILARDPGNEKAQAALDEYRERLAAVEENGG
jgi:tetratricopeptide (TPR) repeat protein